MKRPATGSPTATLTSATGRIGFGSRRRGLQLCGSLSTPSGGSSTSSVACATMIVGGWAGADVGDVAHALAAKNGPISVSLPNRRAW